MPWHLCHGNHAMYYGEPVVELFGGFEWQPGYSRDANFDQRVDFIQKFAMGGGLFANEAVLETALDVFFVRSVEQLVVYLKWAARGLPWSESTIAVLHSLNMLAKPPLPPTLASRRSRVADSLDVHPRTVIRLERRGAQELVVLYWEVWAARFSLQSWQFVEDRMASILRIDIENKLAITLLLRRLDPPAWDGDLTDVQPDLQ